MGIQETNTNFRTQKHIKPFLSRDRKRIFHIYFTNPVTGKRTKRSTRTTVRTKAEDALDNFMKSLNTTSLVQTLPNDLKIKDFELLLYSVSSQIKSRKSLELLKLAFMHLINIIGNKFLHEVSRIDCDIFLNEMIFKVARTTVNIYLRQLKYSFGKAVEYGLISNNPFLFIKQLTVPDKLRVNINSEDIEKLVSVMDDSYMIKFTKFAFLTGMRLSEIINLQWADLNFETNTIFIKNKSTFETKTKKNREIAITNSIRDVLLESNFNVVSFRNPNHYIFGNKNGFRFTPNYISHKFKKYVRKAGLDPKICAHCLRHGALSNMAANGTPIHILQEIAGHADINTTEKYLHSSMDQVRKYMEKNNFGF